jgi:hypothetical protein
VWAIILVVLVAALTLAVTEWSLRASGIAAFPLYRRGCPAGYRMKPDQSGRFRNRIDWAYDRHGMRSSLAPDSLAGLTVLLGDSVVDGGVHVDQSETLAARLTEKLGEPVYPVACHGWSLGNALAGWRNLPGWDRTARLILVVNTGDFDSMGTASSEWSFPTRRPLLLLPWLVARTVYRSPAIGRLLGHRPPPRYDPAFRLGLLEEFSQAMDQFNGQVILVRYPIKDEDPTGEQFYDQLCAVTGTVRGRLIDLAGRPDWGRHCYLDHVHPGPMGLSVLATAIAAEVR